MALAPLGDHIALQGSLHTSPGQSLALEQVKELGHLLHRQASEQVRDTCGKGSGKQVSLNRPSPAGSTATNLGSSGWGPC